LVVTFTEAAAAELRKRIRQRLEEWLVERPGDVRLTEQLALLDAARISTLHGFCLELVRDHFHRLGIDPEVTVLSEEQAALVARETLDDLLRRQYRSNWRWIMDAAGTNRSASWCCACIGIREPCGIRRHGLIENRRN
jgi:ATP-dependent helicase/nuclease subunit A